MEHEWETDLNPPRTTKPPGRPFIRPATALGLDGRLYVSQCDCTMYVSIVEERRFHKTDDGLC